MNPTALRAVAPEPATANGREGGLRIGIDVGGTFTKAVAIAPAPLELVAEAVVPTSHGHAAGVNAGVAAALERLLGELGARASAVRLVAFSTTQAMNALLEGDVPRVGIVGLGARPDLRKARKRTRVGAVALAPGRRLETEHRFLDVTGGFDDAEAERAVDALLGAGCEAIAVSGAFAVDAPEFELGVAELAAGRGVPACCGHQLSGAYGLETRTVSATINAAILPAVERAAGLVEDAMAGAGLDAPLLVLRGDAGAMDVASFRSRPSFTVGSGPAAGVAAALHGGELREGIVLECGGTSTNVSAIAAGRPVLRSIKVMGRPTAIRSIDSWVVGVAGGSMIRIGRRGVAGVGPRSAHGAGLPYACFAEPETLAGATLAPAAPMPGDPADYAVLEGPGGRWAVTATCAANALGLVPEGAHAAGSRESAVLAFEAIAAALRRDPAELAQAAHDAAVEQLGATIDEAAGAAGLGDDAPLVALGGAAEAFGPGLSERGGRELIRPSHPEVLASIGAALTLVRIELERSARAVDASGRSALMREAELACVEAGAAPGTIAVEVAYDAESGLLRAVATGAVALEAGAAERRPRDRAELSAAAAAALGVPDAGLRIVSESDFYLACELVEAAGARRAAIVDRLGGVVFAGEVKAVVTGTGEDFVAALAPAVDDASLNLGLGSLLPRVTVACGRHLVDLSDARNREDLLDSVAAAADGGPAVAVVAR
jgi:N-methylhydantoinase A/oxoprolinase/acetone carboxylase beta subunit